MREHAGFHPDRMLTHGGSVAYARPAERECPVLHQVFHSMDRTACLRMAALYGQRARPRRLRRLFGVQTLASSLDGMKNVDSKADVAGQKARSTSDLGTVTLRTACAPCSTLYNIKLCRLFMA